MNVLTLIFKDLFRREGGQTLSEYALILALIAIISVAALTLLWGNILDILNQIAAAF